MKAYFLSVVLTALFGGLCEELLPESSTLRSHLKLVTGICVIAVLVLPAKDLLVSAGAFFDHSDLGAIFDDDAQMEEYESIFEGSLSRYSAEEIGRYVGAMVAEKFDLAADTCRATAVLNADGTLSRILICLSGKSIFCDPYAIEAYVNEQLSCPCDVAVE